MIHFSLSAEGYTPFKVQVGQSQLGLDRSFAFLFREMLVLFGQAGLLESELDGLVPGSRDQDERDDDRRHDCKDRRGGRPDQGLVTTHPAPHHLGGRRGPDRQRLAVEVELEVLGQLPRRRDPVADAALGRPGHDRLQVAIEAGVDRAEPGHVLVVDQGGELPLVLGLGEEPAAGQQLPERHPQPADVGRRADLAALAAASCSGAA